MKINLVALVFIAISVIACNKQDTLEKVEASKNDVEREANKAVNKIEEATCMESDLECLAEKAKNRVEEGVDYVEDKAEEAVDKMD